jgi:hypothetical protein
MKRVPPRHTLAQRTSIPSRNIFRHSAPPFSVTMMSGKQYSSQGPSKQEASAASSSSPLQPLAPPMPPPPDSSRSRSAMPQPGPIKSTATDYGEYVERLSEYLPQLKCLTKSHRESIEESRSDHRDHVNITITDVNSDSAVTAPRTFHGDTLSEEVLLNNENVAQLRLILVEEITTPVINLLGSTFKIDPEFFAEHLTSTSPNRWSTNCLKKRYISLRWFHPFLIEQKRRPKKGHERADYPSLTKLSAPYGHLTATPTNGWTLHQTNYSRDYHESQRLVAWEERATVFWVRRDLTQCCTGSFPILVLMPAVIPHILNIKN